MESDKTILTELLRIAELLAIKGANKADPLNPYKVTLTKWKLGCHQQSSEIKKNAPGKFNQGQHLQNK